jgi:tetratricopeptide (TPR) repeat protein
MFRFILFTTLLGALISCGNGEDDAVLKNPLFGSLTDSIERDPGNSELWYKRGVLLYQNNYTAYARADVEKAWSLQPKESYALSLANLLRQKSADSAIIFLRSATEKVKGSVALLIALAKGHAEKGEPNEAIEICDAILKQYPTQLDALLLKSELLESIGKETEALATLKMAYGYAPSDVDVAYTLGQKWAESDNPKVIKLADSLIRADVQGRHAEPYLLKGIYYYHTKNFGAAIDLFNQAITKDYNNLDAHMYKGQVYFDQRNYAEAYKSFQLAVTITPSYAEGYYWLAKCQEAVGNKAEAKTNYQRAYGLDKELKDAKDAGDRL